MHCNVVFVTLSLNTEKKYSSVIEYRIQQYHTILHCTAEIHPNFKQAQSSESNWCLLSILDLKIFCPWLFFNTNYPGSILRYRQPAPSWSSPMQPSIPAGKPSQHVLDLTRPVTGRSMRLLNLCILTFMKICKHFEWTDSNWTDWQQSRLTKLTH